MELAFDNIQSTEAEQLARHFRIIIIIKINRRKIETALESVNESC